MRFSACEGSSSENAGLANTGTPWTVQILRGREMLKLEKEKKRVGYISAALDRALSLLFTCLYDQCLKKFHVDLALV